jgi:copper transport protein
MVHIFAAIVWSGGVVLLSIRRKDPRFEEFVSLFSRHALISLLLLIITGVLQTLIIEPDLSELFSTSWGIYLVIKVGAVVLVLLLGAYLRRIIKQKHFSLFKRLLRVDLVLVFVIAILASLISMLNPNPPAKPLNWQDHDAAYAYSVVIDEGRYTISVKMLDASLGIKRVELDVFNKTYPDLGKQTVELSKQVDGTYSGAGAYMTIPGVWDVQLRVMDLSYSEHVYNKAHVIR